jgi:hypothetical protein
MQGLRFPRKQSRGLFTRKSTNKNGTLKGDRFCTRGLTGNSKLTASVQVVDIFYRKLRNYQATFSIPT